MKLTYYDIDEFDLGYVTVALALRLQNHIPNVMVAGLILEVVRDELIKYLEEVSEEKKSINQAIEELMPGVLKEAEKIKDEGLK